MQLTAQFCSIPWTSKLPFFSGILAILKLDSTITITWRWGCMNAARSFLQPECFSGVKTGTCYLPFLVWKLQFSEGPHCQCPLSSTNKHSKCYSTCLETTIPNYENPVHHKHSQCALRYSKILHAILPFETKQKHLAQQHDIANFEAQVQDFCILHHKRLLIYRYYGEG